MGKQTTVAIVGDGNAAHVLIPFLGGTQRTVNLLSLNPHKWDRTVRCEVQNMKHEVLKVISIQRYCRVRIRSDVAQLP